VFTLIERPRSKSSQQEAFDTLDTAFGTDEFKAEDAINAIEVGLEVSYAQAAGIWNQLVDNVNVSDSYTV
jgi:hypothetical protein